MIPQEAREEQTDAIRKKVRKLYRTLLYTTLGYLLGSLLPAKFFGNRISGKDVAAESPDHNPGVYNAFLYGGMLVGILTLCLDLLKGFLPVFLYRSMPAAAASVPAFTGLSGGPLSADSSEAGLALVLAAPVFGHIFPLWHRFRGGKGITVTFGCLLGLLPQMPPVLILAGMFLFFSLVLKVTPNCHRTLFTYLVSAALMYLLLPASPVPAGFCLITAAVAGKLLSGSEIREKCEVKLLWKH